MKAYEKFIKGVIYINVMMYIVSLILSREVPELSFNPLTAFSPESGSLFAMGATGTIAIGQLNRWWTLISAGFLHGSILHIFFNMAAFWQIAPFVINVFGLWRMSVIYTLGTAAGFYISYLAGVKFTIGASAAVCSLICALLYYGKSRGDMFGKELFRQVAGWVVGLFIFGLIVPGINNWAHGGGISAGAAISFFLGYDKRQKERMAYRLLGAGCIGLTGLILLASIVSGFLNRF